jgi:hypothetical protein
MMTLKEVLSLGAGIQNAENISLYSSSGIDWLYVFRGLLKPF